MIQKLEKIFKQKKTVKIIKRAHTFRSFASSYDVEILNSFNPELELKDTESAIENEMKNIID